MKILIVEDELEVATLLEAFFSGEIATAEIQIIGTESDFIRRLPEIVTSPPAIAIVDLMLPWSTPSDPKPEPRYPYGTDFTSDVINPVPDYPYGAGFRIVNALASRPETKSIPIILTSGASLSHLRDHLGGPKTNIFLFEKPFQLSRLRELTRSLVAASREGHERLNAFPEAAHGRKRIFVSYSHRDRKWMQELQVTLRPMLRDEEFVFWNDSQIGAGDKWRSEIEAELRSASIAIFLVSRYFFASDFITKNELPPLLERAARDGVRILWIAVSASDYERSQIAIYQALNDPAHPLDSLKSADRNKELVRIGKIIHEMAAA